MFGRTPLHNVLEDGYKIMAKLLVEVPCSLVKALLEAGADVDLMDKRGQTAIDIAVKFQSSFYPLNTETHAPIKSGVLPDK